MQFEIFDIFTWECTYLQFYFLFWSFCVSYFFLVEVCLVIDLGAFRTSMNGR